MEIFETLLIFVALVIVSSFVHTFIPKVPLAFIQIFLGMILYLTPIPVEFNFDSELFMVTLIAPLLFVEGVNVSRVHLRKYIKPVMMMALGLVITTVIGVGLFIHWIWPELPIFTSGLSGVTKGRMTCAIIKLNITIPEAINNKSFR